MIVSHEMLEIPAPKVVRVWRQQYPDEATQSECWEYPLDDTIPMKRREVEMHGKVALIKYNDDDYIFNLGQTSSSGIPILDLILKEPMHKVLWPLKQDRSAARNLLKSR
eukprot:GHVN01024501.1.p3 GENE.GHVN01024501.1~~GHVN01024501.1.p3  ORF type:complete len:109 (+),score=13.17 GHVN01024501.1:1156-1482(+)